MCLGVDRSPSGHTGRAGSTPSFTFGGTVIYKALLRLVFCVTVAAIPM